MDRTGDNYAGNRHLEVLLIEDNSGDVLLTKEAFEEINFGQNLHVATDGDEAMEFLYKQGKHRNAITPDLILLDLNLPKKDGRELLREIKQNKELRMIPVIVLTTSKSQQDVKLCYDLHANCYIVKPVDFESFIEIVKFIEEFWVKMVTLPSH